MAFCVEIKKAVTVADLIAALQQFPGDMPLENRTVVYRAKPDAGEHYEDPRGCIHVEEDDGTLD
jgi:hypothetical protein